MKGTNREHAADWARQLLSQCDFVVLDTETTGLNGNDEIVSIAIVDPAGIAMLDTLIRPTRPIPRDATRIHGITDDRVVDAPAYDQVVGAIRECVTGRRVVIYNAEFDIRMLVQSARVRGCEGPPYGATAYVDAMEQYAAWVGQYSPRHGNYRYQPLPGGDHTALGDARAALRLIKHMAGQEL